jgi:hypothetical protein
MIFLVLGVLNFYPQKHFFVEPRSLGFQGSALRLEARFLDRLITFPVLSYCTILRLKPRNRFTVAKATNRLHPRVCSRKRTVGVARGFSSFLGKYFTWRNLRRVWQKFRS